ncbi:MAG: abortive infection system antitoxin AbiGi family protein [Candidatus Omnitrophota bacterium]
MPISSNTLFHFTDGVYSIINILTLGFRPKYCLEDFSTIFSSPFKIGEVAIPMTCFCDLPLSQTEKHRRFYGGYGIGMNKEWGVRNKMNPVIYVCPNSYLARQFQSIKTYTAILHDQKVGRFLFQIASRTKLYKGQIWRRGRYKRKCFYDEREWRFVPNKADFSSFVLEKKQYLDEKIRANANKKILEIFKIPFNPDDIKYIIIKNESGRLGMIKAIEEIKGGLYHYNQDIVRILSSKIITSEQIAEDF